MRRSIVTILTLMALFSTLMVSNVSARSLSLWDKPLTVSAFVSQGVQINLHGDNNYDNEKDFNQLLFNFFLEADYRPSQDWILYGSTKVVYDFIYPVKSGDDTWGDKKFVQSSDLRLDDEYWQLLQEAHITWAPRGFLFRLGKQIVSWGEADFFRVMDQINPIDERRGFSDVEFESTIIPIWLWRAEYWPNVQTGWLEELGFQFVLNPNADWIPNQGVSLGNEVGGIWAPAEEIGNPLFGADPIFSPTTYLGGATELIPDPDDWDDDFFDYALRMSMMIYGHIVTLNGFYGIEKTPESLFIGVETDPNTGFPTFDIASDGTTILFPIFEGFYPRKKFIGATWTGDLPFSISALGGVNPTIRTEIRWQFDKVFTDFDQTAFFESNYLDSMIGLDWKVKWNLLNPRAYFTISPQFFWNRVISYDNVKETSGNPNATVLNHIDQDMFTFTLYLATSYMNGKIVPEFAFAWDVNNLAYLIIPSLSYQYSNTWQFSASAAFHGGRNEHESLWYFRNKDYVAFKIKYNWN